MDRQTVMYASLHYPHLPYFSYVLCFLSQFDATLASACGLLVVCKKRRTVAIYHLSTIAFVATSKSFLVNLNGLISYLFRPSYLTDDEKQWLPTPLGTYYTSNLSHWKTFLVGHYHNHGYFHYKIIISYEITHKLRLMCNLLLMFV